MPFPYTGFAGLRRCKRGTALLIAPNRDVASLWVVVYGDLTGDVSRRQRSLHAFFATGKASFRGLVTVRSMARRVSSALAAVTRTAAQRLPILSRPCVVRMQASCRPFRCPKGVLNWMVGVCLVSATSVAIEIANRRARGATTALREYAALKALSWRMGSPMTFATPGRVVRSRIPLESVMKPSPEKCCRVKKRSVAWKTIAARQGTGEECAATTTDGPKRRRKFEGICSNAWRSSAPRSLRDPSLRRYSPPGKVSESSRMGGGRPV